MRPRPALRGRILRSAALAAAVATWATVSQSDAAATPIIYDIGTLSFSGGYSATGTVTTDGTLGPSPVIIAWNVSVAGPRPYTLTELSPGASATGSLVSATATQLVTDNIFTLLAADNTPSDCAICQQRVEWQAGSDRALFQYRDNFDGNPFIFVTQTGLTDSPLVIGTAVPEPGTALLLAAAVVTLAGSMVTVRPSRSPPAGGTARPAPSIPFPTAGR